ncbi:diguanylate cyclase domain-containing protein [Paracoccus aestuariivivens]|uniref:Diguanylate cyclase n=1 Tax=Paracoccus aestuariivivens TaxID=1820333 RepID=A0A6L6JDB7_9RHOB|nr:diguanylate cyclase [Paracoccus aestuariivivens]MTH79205.1 diguanylate cyclase [Paracoccus aestuariivivens]
MITSFGSELAEQIARPKILIVDDIHANLIAMRKLLRGIDAEIMAVDSGNEALSLALDHQFALILLDVQMPDMDGFEVATFLRDNPVSAETPIVFLTASNTDEFSQLKGYMSGAIDYVGKPINERILLSKVAIFLELYQHKQRLVSALTEVHRQRQILQATFDSVADGVIATDNAGRVAWMNPSAQRMTGWDVAEAIGKVLDEVFPLVTAGGTPLNDALFDEPSKASDAASQAMLRTRSGGRFAVTRSASMVRDTAGKAFGGVIVFHDASDAYARQLALIGRAETDPLTGLLNRAGFNKRLQALLHGARDRNTDLALLFGDLDRFKQVNDLHGHAAGDVVLKEIAVRLSNCVRDEDIVARWAGDEFAVLMLCENPSIAQQMARRLAETVAGPIDIGKNDLRATVGISIGISMASAADWNQQVLLERADSLLYETKAARKRVPT